MTRPGRARLAGLMAVPPLLAAVGCGPVSGPGPAPDGGPERAVSSPARPAAGPAVLTIARRGNEITLTGAVADPLAKQTVLDLVAASVADEVTVVDDIGVAPNGSTLDFGSAGPVFETAAAIPDFGLAITSDTVTVSGTAATAREKDAVAAAVADAWPAANIVDRLQIRV